MNLESINRRLLAKLEIRESNESIRTAKNMTQYNNWPVKPGSAAAKLRASLQKIESAKAKAAAPAPKPAASAPTAAPAPAATKPTPAPKATVPARPLHGLAKSIAAHQGKSVSHEPPAEATGLQRAINAHKSK